MSKELEELVERVKRIKGTQFTPYENELMDEVHTELTRLAEENERLSEVLRTVYRLSVGDPLVQDTIEEALNTTNKGAER